MEITLELPNELAERLESQKHRLPQILEFGLRELNSVTTLGYKNSSEVLEFLAALPTPEEIIAFKPSEDFQKQISGLLEKNSAEGLNENEESVWSNYEYLEHLMRTAKAKAFLRLKESN